MAEFRPFARRRKQAWGQVCSWLLKRSSSLSLLSDAGTIEGNERQILISNKYKKELDSLLRENDEKDNNTTFCEADDAFQRLGQL